MEETYKFLAGLGFPTRDAHDLPDSTKRFPDGAQVRIEIPSVEGPNVLAAVIEASKEYEVPIHRVSQGSGIMLCTDAEIREMFALAAGHGIEVSLFVGPRTTWDITSASHTPSGKGQALRHEGMDQLVYALEDIKRGCRLGLRGVLVADEGLLLIVNEMKKAGQLPANLVVKVSVSMGAANPVSIRHIEEMGAGTYNVPSSLTLARLGAIRQAVNIPLDLYVESPDEFGGAIRFYEIPEIVRVVSPVYVKFGLRNAANVYPSGAHIEQMAVAQCREKVRRAALGLEILRRYYPEAIMSETGASDLAVPQI
ncbi:Peptidase family U32 [Paenibacillus sp. yr247]|uniref:U32 family peptidase n=1 Tax=Paenibacillus sp. yr247 TaxID=1761880 RepID=UPI00088B572C|nr:U32 family peptidase [Paenibacillus sp. yr247]SDO38258.1 Peptidase family U32 [Paenibacillus sp. yr247]